jgi:hypothetical protein
MDKKSKIVVMAAVATLLDRWKLTEEQKLGILGFESQMDLNLFMNSAVKLDMSPMLEKRLSLILNIHEALRLLFKNPLNVYGYMTMINNNTPFYGKQPVELASDNIDGLVAVYQAVVGLTNNYS